MTWDVPFSIDVDLPDASGIVSFDAEATVTSMSGTADRWLAEVPETGAKSSDGCWLVMQAWRMEAADGPEAVVSIGPAGPADLVALILDVYGLTARERRHASLRLRFISEPDPASRLLSG